MADPDKCSHPAAADDAGQAAINDALKQIGSDHSDVYTGHEETGHSLVWILLAIAIAFAVVHQFLYHGLMASDNAYLPVLQQFSLAGFLSSFILAIGELLIAFGVRRVSDTGARYNLTRFVRLLIGLAVGIVVISALFSNWTTGLVSLGVLSLVFGLALQVPLSNLFAWIYIIIRQPYRVGDRIRVHDATGDVIDVGYFDTTLWEFGGQYLSTDHPSGRIIKFPNSLVLSDPVYNYSWALFPYIWNEVHVYVAYDCDLEFVTEAMLQAAMEEIGEEMAQRVGMYRSLLARTPVDEIDVNEKPVVLFRSHENTWIEAIVRYIVEPKQAGPVKVRILKKSLLLLNARTDASVFPRSDAR